MNEDRMKMVESILNNKDKLFRLSDVLAVFITTMGTINDVDEDFNYDISLNLVMCAIYCLSKLEQKDFDESPVTNDLLNEMEKALIDYNSEKGNS